MGDQLLDKKIYVYLIDDDIEYVQLFKNILVKSDELRVSFHHSPSVDDALSSKEMLISDIIFIDLSYNDTSSLGDVQKIQYRFPDKALVVLAENQDAQAGVEVVQTGAQDYLIKDQLNTGLLSRVIHHSIVRKGMEVELTKMKMRLQTSEIRSRRLIENNADALVIVNKEGLIRFANPAAEALWGMGPGALIDYSFGYPMTENRVTQIEILKKKGLPVVAEMMVSKLDWEGETAHLVSLRDISQRKKLEIETGKVQKLESMARFSGGIAHDFNNALTSIGGNIQMAKAAIDPKSHVFTLLTRAENSCQKAESLSNLLFNFSMKEKPIKKRISIADFFQDFQWYKPENLYVNFDIDISPQIWDIEAEIESIKETFSYIFKNAEEAMPGGGKIQVKIENLTVADQQYTFLREGNYLKITVKDQGMGIPEKNIGNIFDPYFSTKHERIGLGLSIAYSIIKRHEGFISVQSDEVNGTSFDIYLPSFGERSVAENSDTEKE